MSALRELFNALSNSLRWWVIVAPWEQAMRVRGGKHARLLTPGVHFRVPFWDRVYVQPTRLRVLSTPAQTLATADGKILSIQLLITFRVTDLLSLYGNLHAPSETLEGFAMGAASEYVEGTHSDDVTPSSLATHVRLSVGSMVEGYGLNDLSAQLASFVYVPKAYRLITGPMESTVWGGSVSMRDDRSAD